MLFKDMILNGGGVIGGEPPPYTHLLTIENSYFCTGFSNTKSILRLKYRQRFS